MTNSTTLPPNMGYWFLLEEAAAYARKTPNALYKEMRRNALPGKRGKDGKIRFHRNDLDEYLGA